MREQLRRSCFFKSLDASDGSERSFQLRPCQDDALEIETQVHHIHERNAQECGIQLPP